MKKTRQAKIVVTLGPSTDSLPMLEKLFRSGMDVARLNLSHGNYEEHGRRIQWIRKISKKYQRAVCVLLDLQGPKIRVGRLKGDKSVTLKRNATVQITTQNILGDENLFSTTYANLPKDVQRGGVILLDDGNMELRVLSKSSETITCKVMYGGLLRNNVGINLPGTKISAPALTKKDLRDLTFGVKEKVDAVALSFVRSPQDIIDLKKSLKQKRYPIPVIAKIERWEALENLEGILKEADGVMVARGDLGVELSIEEVPVLQKNIIAKANQAGKVVITATQMLESMIRSPHPTRAEASDVANAVYDGSDCLMLSGETARGEYPIESVKMMANVIAQAETNAFLQQAWVVHRYHEDSKTHAIVHAAVQSAEKVKAKAIMVFSMSGATIRMMSKVKPRIPIIGLSPNVEVCRKMALYWGVRPVFSPWGKTTAQMIVDGGLAVLERDILKRGDTIVVVSGTQHILGATNMMKIHSLGDGL